MKSSIYNTPLTVCPGKWLIYNSFHDRFICVFSENNPLLPEVYESDGCTFKQKLIENRFLIDDAIDEHRLLQDKLDTMMKDDSTYELHINPTLDCNLNCWYCYENHVRGSKVSDQDLNRISLLIKRICENTNLRHLYISFFGGEPLMRFEKVVKKIMLTTEEICQSKKISTHFHFTTNGSLLSEKMVGFFKNYDVKFQITLDGGKEPHNKVRHFKNGVGTYDRILKNIESLTQAGCYVTIRINYTAENINSVGEALNQIIGLDGLVKKYISVDLQRVWQDTVNKFNDQSIIEGFEDLLKGTGIKYSCPQKRDLSLQICYGDRHNYALINYNGDVFKCTARDFTTDNRVGTLSDNGEISWIDERLNMWEKAKMSRKECLECPIAPICGGGCRQKNIETKKAGGCLLGFDEDKMKNIVFDKFLALAENNYPNLF